MNTPTVCPLYTAGMCPKMAQAPMTGVSPAVQGNPNMQPVNYMPMNTQPMSMQPMNVQPMNVQPMNAQPMNVQPTPCNNYSPIHANPINPYMVNPYAGMNYNSMMGNPGGGVPMQAPGYRFDTPEEIQDSGEFESENLEYSDRGVDFDNSYANDSYPPSINMKTVDSSEIED